MNPTKAAPYALGGLLGGSALKSAFGGKKDSKPQFGGGASSNGAMTVGAR